MTVATVRLWGRDIGAISWDDERRIGYFEYNPVFQASGIELSPIKMPLGPEIYSFADLERKSFYGLPGMLADSLPDKFGHALINAWLVRKGRSVNSFNPVERLCYVGSRGIGALEYHPNTGSRERTSKPVDVGGLVDLASAVLKNRENLSVLFEDESKAEALTEILKVGTSAGGARAKAVIAWNEKTNEIRSGQVKTDEGFSHWILKFDGVEENRDKELNDAKGYGLIEYAYSMMARAAGIEMMECRILKEGSRCHFMTKRFDRTDVGEKIHMQSLAALEHFDFNLAGAYSYEQTFRTIRKLGLGIDAIEEQFRRMAFNIIARNQDDHVKNIAFLMDKVGNWSLSPAYDMTYAFNPEGLWTGQHQMSLQGKRDDFIRDDFINCAKLIGMMRGRAEAIIEDVVTAVKNWPSHAEEAGIDADMVRKISSTHRLDIL